MLPAAQWLVRIIFIWEIHCMIAVRSSSDSASIHHVKSIILKLWEDLHDGRQQTVVLGAINNPT